tara:strand:+ start:17285 stop:19408 length:2124 start_codon:yes stop_codon:yes gene_type:complete
MALYACGGDDSSDPTTPPEETIATNRVMFSPSSGELSLPSDLLFQGSEDGTLNIPLDQTLPIAESDAGCSENELADRDELCDQTTEPASSLSALDGWSTTASIIVHFRPNYDVDGTPEPINTNAVIPGQNFHIVALNPVGMVLPSDYEVMREDLTNKDVDGPALKVNFKRALDPQTQYAYVLTTGIKDITGNPIQPDISYAQAKFPEATGNAPLDGLRQIINELESGVVAILSGAGIELAKEDIALAAPFTTLSTDAVLRKVRESIISEPAIPAFVQPAGTTNDINPLLPGIANVYAGGLTVNYYQTPAIYNPETGLALNPAPLLEFWEGQGGSHITQYNPVPVVQSKETIPLFVSVPNANSGNVAKPENGWPVVIFQHGVTQERSNMFAVADSMAAAGLAVVAIDLPLHGMSATFAGNPNPFFAGYDTADGNGPLRERTFGLDFVENGVSSCTAQPDGQADPSGQHFMNLSSLRTARDNGRQASADLVSLTHAIDTIDVDGDGMADMDPNRIYFVGHSMGGIVGVPFVAVEERVRAAAFVSAGGQLMRLLEGSQSFGPILTGGLACQGVTKGMQAYEDFMYAAQSVLDATDPVNFAHLIEQNSLILEIVANGDHPGDTTVPAEVAGAPLAGTEGLVSQMGLTPIVADVQNAEGVSGVIRYTEGDHGSLLSPAASPLTTLSMQTAIASFFASDAKFVDIADGSPVTE